MKQLAATVSKQRGIQYEFGPEYEEYCAKKAAGILDVTHIKPLSEISKQYIRAYLERRNEIKRKSVTFLDYL